MQTTQATMEDNIDILLNHIENKEKCINSLVLNLTSSLLNTKHDSDNCGSFRRTLQVLGMVIKVKCTAMQRKNQESSEHLPEIEDILNIFFETLNNFVDVKDLCIPIICEVLCSSLVLLPRTEMDQKITVAIHKCLNLLSELLESPLLIKGGDCIDCVEVKKIGINLRIWEHIIDFMNAWTNKSHNSECNPFVQLKTLFDDEFTGLLLKLTSLEYDFLTAQTLLCLVPKLVTFTESNSIIKKLWVKITEIFYSTRSGNRAHPQFFLIMCALAEYFVPINHEVPYSFPIGQISDFWYIVQYGLVSNDSLMRKQALFLLQRAVEREATISTPGCEMVNAGIFWWNEQNGHQYVEVWNEIYMLLEVLEEKQMHLIEPVQPVIISLVKACQKYLLDPSWILCIIQRALIHECHAVVKWGIVCYIELDINLYMDTNVNYSFILSLLMSALNSSSFYIMTSKSLSVPDIVEKLRSFFITVAESQMKACEYFFRSLLNSLVQVSWGPVALFYVVYALSAVPKCPVWNVSDILMLKRFLIEVLATQVVHIRGAIQSLFIEALINLADEQHLEVSAVADILGSFRRHECLRRGTLTWCKVTSWLKSFLSEEQAFIFAQKSFAAIVDGEECEKQAAARMIVLLSDTDLICLARSSTCHMYDLSFVLSSHMQYFENCHERMYVSRAKQDSWLEALIYLLQECQPIVENDHTGNYIISLVSTSIPGIFYCVKMHMFSAYNLECYDTVSLYLRALSALSKEPRLSFELLKHALMIQDASFTIANSECKSTTSMSKYFCIRILFWISDFINRYNIKEDGLWTTDSSELYRKQITFIENMLRRNLNEVLIKGNEDKPLTCEMQKLWGKIVSKHMQAIWSLINLYIEIQPQSSILNLDSEISSCILRNTGEALDIGGRGMLIPVMSVIQQILHLLVTNSTTEEIENFLQLCWDGIFDLRKCDLFYISLKKFIQMTFQKCLIDNIQMTEVLHLYAQKIISQGENVKGICNIFFQQLQEVAKHYNLCMFQPFPDILIDALMFGCVQRRDRKLDDDTCAFITSLGDKCYINDVSDIWSEADVRARGINLLLTCQGNETHNNMKVLVSVSQVLLERDRMLSLKRKRYFADSPHHKHRNRIMQVLLLLERLLPEEEQDKLITHFHNSILVENHLPSIRYFQEWLLIKLMYKKPNTHSQIWSVLQAASETRPRSLCSFISIVYHIAHVLSKDDGLEDFIDKGMKEILPCTMAQHFNVRLYAQVIFIKIWEFAQKEALNKVAEKYQIVYMSIMGNLCAPSTLKSIKKLENFYFTVFHPLEHYSLQTIFYEFPRLTNMSQDQWISVETLSSCGVKETVFPLVNKNEDLRDCNPLSDIDRSDLRDDSDSVCMEVGNVQKKIVPWKSVLPDPEITSASLRRKPMTKDGLIVVASLINRPPNLGGLCRTCEIFGVSQYIIGNMKYIEDAQFQMLSVTAERWIDILQVKPEDLLLYLNEKKCEGYTVVGAEQTANGVLLNTVQFPKRTVLLLGNEKQGIPANLLPLLDICIEIPQQGVIRSMNVHVSGALFIWEYARQHNVKC